MGAVMKKMMIASDLDSDSDADVEFFFPLEMMYEIFSWLTVASLLRCKCVCKRWKEIIQHSKFTDMHMKRTKEKRVYYISEEDRTAKTFTILQTCNGLLLEESKINGIYRVRNPATKQLLDLPSPKVVCFSMFIVYIASTDSYKLVCMHDNKVRNGWWTIGFKVLSVGDGDLSWRAHENLNFHGSDRKQGITLISEGSLIYCLALYQDGLSDGKIHCLDMEAEIVNDNPTIVPRSFFSDWESILFAKWGKKLALTGIVDEDLHVWVVEDFIRGKWAEKKIIIPVTYLKENPDMKERLVLCSASSEEIWFRRDDTDYITYFISSKEMRKSQHSARPGKEILIGRQTLVSLKGMRPQEEIDNYRFL